MHKGFLLFEGVGSSGHEDRVKKNNVARIIFLSRWSACLLETCLPIQLPPPPYFSQAPEAKEIYSRKVRQGWGAGRPLVYFKGLDDIAGEMGSLVSELKSLEWSSATSAQETAPLDEAKPWTHSGGEAG